MVLVDSRLGKILFSSIKQLPVIAYKKFYQISMERQYEQTVVGWTGVKPRPLQFKFGVALKAWSFMRERHAAVKRGKTTVEEKLSQPHKDVELYV